MVSSAVGDGAAGTATRKMMEVEEEEQVTRSPYRTTGRTIRGSFC
jgi:hypothetical protein